MIAFTTSHGVVVHFLIAFTTSHGVVVHFLMMISQHSAFSSKRDEVYSSHRVRCIQSHIYYIITFHTSYCSRHPDGPKSRGL